MVLKPVRKKRFRYINMTVWPAWPIKKKQEFDTHTEGM